MQRIRNILFIMAVLTGVNAIADSQLLDPVTGAALKYYDASSKEKLNSLNPFTDIEFVFPVIRNNVRCSDSIHNYVHRFTGSAQFKQRLKDHAMQAVANFIDYSESAKEMSLYERKALMDQNVVLDEVDVKLSWYYNGRLGIYIESKYAINKNYDNFKEETSMFQVIYVDANTGDISELNDLCPPALRHKFNAYLSKNLNSTITVINASDKAKKKNKSEDEEAYEEDSEIEVKPATRTTTHDVINFSDLMLDMNALNFFVAKNATNTLHTGGSPFAVFVKEDSLNYYLPFTINKQKRKFDDRLLSREVNKKLNIYRNEYTFLQDEYLLDYFEQTLNAKEITVFQRQNLIADTTFKLHMRVKYNYDHTMSALLTNFESKDFRTLAIEKADDPWTEKGILKNYFYLNGFLEKIEQADQNGKKKDIALYVYNPAGLITNFMDYQEEYQKWEHSYSYSGFSVNDCSVSAHGNVCYTTQFDSAGNFVSRTETGTVAGYKNIYRNNLLMATGTDMLYSYNAGKKIESIERERGRYYVKYYYDDKNRITSIVHYDGRELSIKNEVTYDSGDRITFVKQTNYSYGKIQAQIEFQLVYN